MLILKKLPNTIDQESMAAMVELQLFEEAMICVSHGYIFVREALDEAYVLGGSEG